MQVSGVRGDRVVIFTEDEPRGRVQALYEDAHELAVGPADDTTEGNGLVAALDEILGQLDAVLALKKTEDKPRVRVQALYEDAHELAVGPADDTAEGNGLVAVLDEISGHVDALLALREKGVYDITYKDYATRLPPGSSKRRKKVANDLHVSMLKEMILRAPDELQKVKNRREFDQARIESLTKALFDEKEDNRRLVRGYQVLSGRHQRLKNNIEDANKRAEEPNNELDKVGIEEIQDVGKNKHPSKSR